MAPTPQEHVSAREDLLPTESDRDLALDGEKIVISGLSGLYPSSHNVKELSDILYNKENPIKAENPRWNYKHTELADYAGLAPELDKFDSQFFTVPYRLSYYMDPMSRKILEQTYQALYDAGVNPVTLSGKKVAVYIGSSYSDTETTGFYNIKSKYGLGIVGCSKTMFANRISYWLNTKGPSLAIDDADCSATTALEQAYLDLKRGACESAIVGTAYIHLQPHAAIHHSRLSSFVCKDGKTKSFAQDSDGYILSDALSVIFLQKAKDALRVHAELVHVKNEFLSVLTDENGPKYGYIRNPQSTANFIKQFYNEAQVKPQSVEYVEAYGTGVPDADKSELEAIEEVYCKDREEPLLVGSVTSNIGLTGAASGISAITKVVLGYHKGTLAGNLHCSKPRQDVAALRDGRMRIVTEHERFERSYVAINNMSTTGINSHMLLHGHYKPKDLSRYKSSIPHLVTISGRQESAVEKIFEYLKCKPVDPEELALMHQFHSNGISGHLGRGYIILDTDEEQNTVSLNEKSAYFDDGRRPLWFVYSGMGSQWTGMGAQLMRIPIFAAAIERCHAVLKPRGLDIVNILTSSDKTMFDNICHSFVGIAAIQIGLTDILRELGLKPDGMIGHSVGELGCAYADGCLTAEEMILCAYSRGLVSVQTKFIKGSMAAVGLGYEQISKICPPEIDVACHNGPDSSTISGPADVMAEFVAELTGKGVFAKEVPCSNIAYHSRYIKDAGPDLLKYLQEVIKSPKPRSERWLSTSVPQEKWNESSAKYCSAEYQTNNLLSPVLFDETTKLVPSNAVLVEVAPHGLLQAILKRSMPTDCRHVSLAKRGHPDNALFLLQSIGELYMHGCTPNVQALYPKVQFPVSTETPMLSHLVEWVHNETWNLIAVKSLQTFRAAACNMVISIHDDEYSYLQGHVVREKMCYPFAAALVSVWDTLAMYLGVPKNEMSVQFNNVHLYAQPTLFDQRPLRLSVNLHKGNRRFEVMNETYRVAAGYILDNIDVSTEEYKIKYEDETDLALDSKAIYQLLQDRDYNYSGEFQSIEAANSCLNQAAVQWNNNWVTLIDGLLQLNALRQPHNAVSLPTKITRLSIDVKEHVNLHQYQINDKTVMKAYVTDVNDYTRCGGVLVQNIKFHNLPPVDEGNHRLDLVIPSTQVGNNTEANGTQLQLIVATDSIVTLQCAQIGDLGSMQWVEAPQVGQSDVTVQVHYAGLSMSDVKRAIGVTSCGVNSYGMDYSGITASGSRVMGLVRVGAASSVVRAQQELMWPVPAHWTLEDAATVPLAYAHAFYCLMIKGALKPGMNVLVHGGAGALGQAAIAIALGHQCQVFTTVSDVRKKKFLRKLYPQLKDEHIGGSRNCSFADLILNATKGEGCDIVLSCVKGELRNLSMKCCGSFAVLIDTDQLQNREDYVFGMNYLTDERNYVFTDFSSIFTHEKYDEMKSLQAMLSDGINKGYVRPLSRVTYAPHDAARAFRLLAASRHRGRVLLRMQDSVSRTYLRIMCNHVQHQLLFWDDGALGVQLTDRLVDRGARRLYIHCRSVTSYQNHKIESWRKLGVEVVLSSEDLLKNNNAYAMIHNVSTLGGIEGIYVVITKISDDKNKEDLTIILEALDSASRLLCRQLKYFAVLSLVSALGQSTCRSRTKCGYPATSLDLSCMSEVNAISIKPQLYVRDALNATEHALHNASPVLLARPAPVQTPDMLQQLVAVADLNIPENTSSDVTLQDLGMEYEKIPAICALLNVVYNISLQEENIPLLTLRRINELAEATSDVILENKVGLGTFFSNIEENELLAAVEFVVLPTLNKDSTLNEQEFNMNNKYLCIVPGMEGQFERFRLLCERLKLRALVLQPRLDRPHESVRETAEKYAQVLLKKMEIQNNFYLLGYESGVLVILELAAILEDHGLTGTVFCIGSSPEEFRTTLDYQIGEFKTQEELQEAILRHMCVQLTEGHTMEINDALQSATTWSEKVDACVRSLLGHMTHTAQYAREIIEAARARIECMRNYVVKPRALRSKLVLLRAMIGETSALASLQLHSQQQVVVHQLRTPLSYVLKDMECPAIVNKHLDADIQNEFNENNLCVSYRV